MPDPTRTQKGSCKQKMSLYRVMVRVTLSIVIIRHIYNFYLELIQCNLHASAFAKLINCYHIKFYSRLVNHWQCQYPCNVIPIKFRMTLGFPVWRMMTPRQQLPTSLTSLSIKQYKMEIHAVRNSYLPANQQKSM